MFQSCCCQGAFQVLWCYEESEFSQEPLPSVIATSLIFSATATTLYSSFQFFAIVLVDVILFSSFHVLNVTISFSHILTHRTHSWFRPQFSKVILNHLRTCQKTAPYIESRTSLPRLKDANTFRERTVAYTKATTVSELTSIPQ